jgi:HAD superfamily hydrolase (TIGR01509 family)
VIRAIIFDFDGLMVDTEEPIFEVWQRIYREHGEELPLEQWLTIIGGTGKPGVIAFDPVDDLGRRLGKTLDSAELKGLEKVYYRAGTAMQQLLPGVRQYLEDARRLKLATAIASSSSRRWIDEHLSRIGIEHSFDAIVSRDDVKKTKPDPELYLAAVTRLRVAPHEAIALEDSSNGLAAAKAAGLYSVAVPNAMTASMDLSRADLTLTSLEAMPLEELIRQPSLARSQPPGPGHPAGQTSG